MKHSWLPLSAVCIALLLTAACAPEREAEPAAAFGRQFDPEVEEAAIREVWDEIITTFNGHDAKGWAALFDESFESWTGDVKGPRAEERYMTEYFQRQQGVEYMQLEEIGLVFVTPDLAIYKTYGQVSNVVGTDGSPRPPSKILEGWVFVKRSDNWKAAACFLRPVDG